MRQIKYTTESEKEKILNALKSEETVIEERSFLVDGARENSLLVGTLEEKNTNNYRPPSFEEIQNQRIADIETALAVILGV